MKKLMGRWLEKWRTYQQKKHQGRLESYEKLIRKVNVHKQERRAAIQFFGNFDDDIEFSLRALLKRFDFSDDNSIIDGKEKEAALRGITSKGEAAIPIIKEYLKTKDHIAWPLKALLKLSDEKTVVQSLEESLDFSQVDFEQHKVEKNYDILCHLMDYDTPCDLEKIAHFLEAKDERVRYAATELLTDRGDEKVLPKLEPFVYDESAENRRLRTTILDAYVDRSWRLKDKLQFSKLELDGFHINSKGGVSRVTQS